MTRIHIDLPKSFRGRARQLAKRDGVSLQQLITSALGEKMSVLEAQDYMAHRARRASCAKYDAVLRKVKHRQPVKGDEIP